MSARSIPALGVLADQVTINERLRRIDALDLEPIVYTLTHPADGGPALSLAEADHDVALYRCFLKLCLLHPAPRSCPPGGSTTCGTHMLDTAKYRADCIRVLGRFLDHFPYAGLRGEDDRHAWQEDFAHTRRLFRKHFGVEIGNQPAASVCSDHGDGSDCCTGCIKPAAGDVRPRPERR
jgi:hypothetical protein